MTEGKQDQIQTEKPKRKRTAAWVVLAVIIAFLVIAFTFPTSIFRFLSYGAGVIIGDVFFYGALLLIPVFLTLLKNWPKLEMIKGINAVLFVAGCIPFTVNWFLWIPPVPLSILYLKNAGDPALANGKTAGVIAVLVLSILGLVFVAQYLVRNGWGPMFADAWKK